MTFQEKLFIGGFEHRGLASIVFAIIVQGIDFPHMEVIILTVVITVFLSIVLHGLTANQFLKTMSRVENTDKVKS